MPAFFTNRQRVLGQMLEIFACSAALWHDGGAHTTVMNSCNGLWIAATRYFGEWLYELWALQRNTVLWVISINGGSIHVTATNYALPLPLRIRLNAWFRVATKRVFAFYVPSLSFRT